MSVFKKSFPFGAHTVTIETGELARQANGSVLVTMGDTVVLVTFGAGLVSGAAVLKWSY